MELQRKNTKPDDSRIFTILAAIARAASKNQREELYKAGKKDYSWLDPQAAPTAPQAVARIFSRVMVMPTVEDSDGAEQLFVEQQSGDFVSKGQF